MPLWRWSQTAAANASADPTVNYMEGQAPSSINDSARAAMAAVAMYRDDIAGAILTSGTATAYTVTSFSGFDTLPHLAGQMIAFSPHATNGATVTLNVDGLGAKPLRSAPNVELLAGTIVAGTPYIALYNDSDGAFYLTGFFGNPYNVPLASGIDYWAATAPNSSFAFPVGQAISRTTYATLFSLIGTTYGVGDGSTTFNLPDKIGRVSAMRDPVGIRITGTYFTSTDLGGSGGGQDQTLTLAQLPGGITASVSVSGGVSVSAGGNFIPVTNGPIGDGTIPGGGPNHVPAATSTAWTSVTAMAGSGSMTGSSTSNNTGGTPHRTVQPTIVCNYILRII